MREDKARPRPLRLGVLIPESNTILRTDFAALTHAGQEGNPLEIVWEDLSMGSGRQTNDAEHARVIAHARASTETAARRLASRDVDAVVMGFVIETFWGGRKESAQTISRIKRAAAGLPVIAGGEAALAALTRLGAARIGLITPYQPAADKQVKQFFEESGVMVAGVAGLRAPSATAIAEIDSVRISEAVHALASLGVDAVVQIGTNLSILDQVGRLESEVGRPVLAMNALLYEHALRLSADPGRL